MFKTKKKSTVRAFVWVNGVSVLNLQNISYIYVYIKGRINYPIEK